MKITISQFEILKSTCICIGIILILIVLYVSYKMDNTQEKNEEKRCIQKDKKSNKIFDQSLYQSFQIRNENDEYLEKNILNCYKKFENGNYSSEKINSNFEYDSFFDDFKQISSNEILKNNDKIENDTQSNIDNEKMQEHQITLEESFLMQMNNNFSKFKNEN